MKFSFFSLLDKALSYALILVCCFVLTCYILSRPFDFWLLGKLLFIISLIKLLNALGNKLLFEELICFFGITQLLFAPAYFLGLKKNLVHSFTAEHIMDESYFDLAFPAVTLFILLLKFANKTSSNYKFSVDNLRVASLYEKNNYYLMLGIVSLIILPVSPSSLRFVFVLLSNFAAIAVVIKFFNSSKLPLLAYVAVIIVSGVASGMLGAFIWPLLLLTVYLLYFSSVKISLTLKALFFVMGMFVLSVFQLAKFQYRAEVWNTDVSTSASSLEKVERFGDIVVSKIKNLKPEHTDFLAHTIMLRLDQGYIVNWTIDYVPKNEPFANGETIGLGVISSFVPRFFWPNKPKAGGKENMKRFAGITLTSSSFEIGFLGEAYVNFGRRGGIVFMGLWGFTIGWLLGKWKTKSIDNPLFIFLPLMIFYGGFNSFDITFTKSLNTLIKGLFIFYMARLAITKFSKYRI